ncbi:MAG TPA: tetratricopeptide repeat protein [Caulifigura sp.]|nr:tetratricopeptide repeat protein [Caulifigura sp.]
MRARLATPSAAIESATTLTGPNNTIMARLLNGALAVAGLSWIAFASTLCGCNSVNGYVMNESGKAYYRRGDYTAARHEFERALMDSPENANYAYNVAAAMQQQGDAMAAEKMYQHALVIDPGHEASYEGLAHLLYNNDRTGEAEQLLTAWSEAQPYDENSSIALAKMQDTLGNPAAADMAYDRALAANPNNSRLNNEMGNHYRRAGRRRDAAMAYQRGLMQNPYNADLRSDAEMLAASQSPALLMAQQMPQYDPTFLPPPPAIGGYGPTPAIQQAPYIGSANFAQQSAPTIYQGTFGPAAGSMLPPSYKWGTPATVPVPATNYGNGGMIANTGGMMPATAPMMTAPMAAAPSGTAFFMGSQAPAWSAPISAPPVMAPQMGPTMGAPTVMPAGGVMMQQPMMGQPQVVPAF